MPSDWQEDGLSAKLDAYADWVLGPERDYVRACHEPGSFIPVIVELTDEHSAEDFQRAVYAAADERGVDRRCLCLPAWHRHSVGAPQPYRLSALVSDEFFGHVAEDPAVRRMISRILVGQRLSPAAVNHHAGGATDGAAPSQSGRVKPLPDGAPEEGTVVVGIIDDAIAFAHERFRRGDPQSEQTSRVEHAWVQDLAGDPPHASNAVPYGREFNKDGIDRLIKESTTPAAGIDEDRLYRRAGVIDFGRPGYNPLAWRAAHGTHVMDLAGGDNPEAADASRPIVCVQLPATVTADSSGAGLAPYVLDGIWYILDRADEIARKRQCGRLPVVINFSYGILAGPHDGTHPIELAIDSAIQNRAAPLAVVVPSGNRHLARCHAQVAFAKRDEEVLNWRILPDDKTSTFMEIWLPYSPKHDSSRLTVSIAPPGHDFDRGLGEDPGNARVWKPQGHVLCKLSYELVPASNRGRFMVAVLPTASDGAAPALAPSGLWRIKLENTGLGKNDLVHLWIQRDDAPHGYPVRGRQSYFEDPQYERFDAQGRVIVDDEDMSQTSLVRRAGSISALATGTRSVVVGGLVERTKAPARYSGNGPITAQMGAARAHRTGPDVLAVSDRSEVQTGVLAAGSRSGSVLTMSGTSVAAPQVARWIADYFSGRKPHGGLSPAEKTVVARLNGNDTAPSSISDQFPPAGW